MASVVRKSTSVLSYTYIACIIYILSYSICAFSGQIIVMKGWHSALQVGMKFDIRWIKC